MSLITFIIYALATWRLASLFADDQGPFDIFARFRYWAGERERVGTNFFAKGLICVWCVSMWVSIILVTLWILYPAFTLVMIPFALSAVACIINGLVE